jgi:hypothetical protein
MVSGVVLVTLRTSTYHREYASVPAASLEGHFERPRDQGSVGHPLLPAATAAGFGLNRVATMRRNHLGHT